MITIRKIEGGEVFDLPQNYVIEAEKNNPMFSNKGSQTVPINFPTTIKNNRLLNFPQRIDRSDRQEGTIGVIVETGSVQQKGLLSVNSAGPKIISANIGYDESEMYAVMKDMQLRDMPVLNSPDYAKSFGGNNIDQLIDSALAHLTAVMKEQIEEDYFIFPIIVKKQMVQEDDNSITYLEKINDIDTTADINNLPYGRIAELKALENRTINRYENGEEIQFIVPKGYGVSPFLRVHKILEIIFKNFGLEITENPFKEHRQLKKLVALNNTIDAVLTGTIYYKDLMPDCTIQQFIDSLYAKFGMLWFMDSNTKTVRIRFLNEIFSIGQTPGAIDLNMLKTKEPEISFKPAKQLRLKMNREIEGTEVPINTMEEFLDRFNNIFTEHPGSSESVTQRFLKPSSTYEVINIFTMNSSNRVEETSSDFFDWDKKTENLDYEDIEMTDLCLSLNIREFYYLQYLVGFKHQYSDIFVGGSKKEISGDKSKIAFAFAWGLTPFRGSAGEFRRYFASQFNRDDIGDFIKDENGIKYDISLTCNREDGLFNRFWKEYDAFLRHSNQPVKCDLHLSDREFIDYKIDQIAFLNNQPLITEQIKYKFNDDKGDKICESSFRTLKLYTPNDIASEQNIPIYYPQMLYWAMDTEIIGSEPPAGSKFLQRMSDPFFTVNGVQVPISHVNFLPPTQMQYLSKETRIFKFREKYKFGVFIYFLEKKVTYYPALIK